MTKGEAQNDKGEETQNDRRAARNDRRAARNDRRAARNDNGTDIWYRLWGSDNMILIIGGKYQGKHDYAIEHFGDSKIIDFDEFRKSGWGMQGFTGKYCYGCESGGDQENAVIIAEENASGVVPADPGLIRQREEYNRSLKLLAEKADEIYRVFCGIGMKIK